jgi:hypothetical protein
MLDVQPGQYDGKMIYDTYGTGAIAAVLRNADSRELAKRRTKMDLSTRSGGAAAKRAFVRPDTTWPEG